MGHTLEEKKALLEKYKKEYHDDSSEQLDRAIYTYNKMIKNGKSAMEAYSWLMVQKRNIEADFERRRGFHMDFSFSFLYPDMCGPIPDTYEEWVEKKKNGGITVEEFEKWFDEKFGKHETEHTV